MVRFGLVRFGLHFDGSRGSRFALFATTAVREFRVSRGLQEQGFARFAIRAVRKKRRSARFAVHAVRKKCGSRGSQENAVSPSCLSPVSALGSLVRCRSGGSRAESSGSFRFARKAVRAVRGSRGSHEQYFRVVRGSQMPQLTANASVRGHPV